MDGTLPSLVLVKFLLSMDFVHVTGLSFSEGITGGEARCPAVKKEPSLKLPLYGQATIPHAPDAPTMSIAYRSPSV